MTKQNTANEVYAAIMKDLDFACGKSDGGTDRLPMNYAQGTPNSGRVTKAAALMLKARVVLYQKDAARYGEVTKDMAEIIKAAGQNCSVKKNVKMNNFILYRQFMST